MSPFEQLNYISSICIDNIFLAKGLYFHVSGKKTYFS